MEVTDKWQFLNTHINSLDSQELLDELDRRLERRIKTSLCFLNVDVVIKIEKDPALKQAVENADFVLLDGMPLVWISKLYRQEVKEKISGSDFVPKLLEMAARKGRTVFLAGGKEGVAAQAAENMRAKIPGLRFAGISSPPFGFEKREEEIRLLNDNITKAGSDILVICLGCPKQEIYMEENRDKYQAWLSVCAGATVDFLAGHVKRCPPWMSRHGLEWFYRFLQEPRRLFKRYFIDDMKIIILAWKYRPGKRGRGKYGH